MIQKKPSSAAFMAANFVVLLDLLGFGLILPHIPLLKLSSTRFHLSIGALSAVYSLMQAFGSFIFGKLSDRLDRFRPLLLISILGDILSYILCSIVSPDNVFGLIIARGIAGFFGGSLSLAQAWVLRNTHNKTETAKRMAMIGGSIGLGFTLGPLFGGLFASSFSSASFLAAIISGMNLIFCFVFFHDYNLNLQKENSTSNIKKNSSGGIGLLLFASFCISTAFVGMETSFTTFARHRFSMDHRSISKVFFLIGTTILLSTPLIRVTKASPINISVFATLGMTFSIYFIGISSSIKSLYVSIFFASVSEAFLLPSLPELFSSMVPESLTGTMIGSYHSVKAISRIFSPLLAGYITDKWDFYISHSVLAGFALISLIFLLILKKDDIKDNEKKVQ